MKVLLVLMLGLVGCGDDEKASEIASAAASYASVSDDGTGSSVPAGCRDGSIKNPSADSIRDRDCLER